MKDVKKQRVGSVVKRIAKEFAELIANPVPHIKLLAVPAEPRKWHFIFYGPINTPFEGGEYHGEITFEQEYPVNPPLTTFRTYNGRCIKGEQIAFIEPKWWQPSITMRQVLQELLSTFVNNSPRPNGVLFEESYRLRMQAERSKYSGCVFCGKRDRTGLTDKDFVAACKKWLAEEEVSTDPIGHWWHQLREVVIKHEERELRLTLTRNYELCTERLSQRIYSSLILFNWKTLARHVLAPIIYRFILLLCLVGVWTLLILFVRDQSLPLMVRVPAIVDLVVVPLIMMFETFAIVGFCKSRQTKGCIRVVSRYASSVALSSVIIHLVSATIISDALFKCDDRTTLATVYTALAFGNDFYHYFMGVLLYLNTLLYYVGSIIESLCRFRPCRRCRKFPASLEKYSLHKDSERNMVKDEDICHICSNSFLLDEDILRLGCNPDHVFHLDCLQDLSSTRCIHSALPSTCIINSRFMCIANVLPTSVRCVCSPSSSLQAVSDSLKTTKAITKQNLSAHLVPFFL